MASIAFVFGSWEAHSGPCPRPSPFCYCTRNRPTLAGRLRPVCANSVVVVMVPSPSARPVWRRCMLFGPRLFAFSGSLNVRRLTALHMSSGCIPIVHLHVSPPVALVSLERYLRSRWPSQAQTPIESMLSPTTPLVMPLSDYLCYSTCYSLCTIGTWTHVQRTVLEAFLYSVMINLVYTTPLLLKWLLSSMYNIVPRLALSLSTCGPVHSTRTP